jgi:hypothetical protein
MRIFFIILFFVSVSVLSLSQSNIIRLKTENGLKEIPIYIRENNKYIQAESFAEAVGADFSYESPDKILIERDRKKLLITAKNPFYVINDNSR